MKKTQMIISLLIMFLLGTTLTSNGCIASKESGKIVLRPSEITMKEGETQSLTLKHIPNKEKKHLAWTTSNKTIVAVTAKDLNPAIATVRAVSAGSAEICVKYRTKKYRCRVLVEKKKEPSVNPTYTQITQEQAMQMMAANDGHVVVDVRNADEYAEGHIPGAILVPLPSIGETMPEQLPDLSQIILVYCRSGRRSKEAAQKLAELGYTHVYEFGGIIDWSGPVVRT